MSETVVTAIPAAKIDLTKLEESIKTEENEVTGEKPQPRTFKVRIEEHRRIPHNWSDIEVNIEDVLVYEEANDDDIVKLIYENCIIEATVKEVRTHYNIRMLKEEEEWVEAMRRKQLSMHTTRKEK